MKVTQELSFKMFDFDNKFWDGAARTYEHIRSLNKLDELEDYLDFVFPDGATLTELNDFLWFNDKEVYADLGIKPPYEEGEDDEEEA